ncbi:alpha/beta fold hydrolase [Streptomyces sp. MNP-20]|uniref:alpha/beta fold hydrolase n=1 Tax=Streptomyces sp. MNP-20 TaxID=2721165 RepID=UPI001552B4C1|nr:alpha/beta fold hydrolase [Streptomyces sp. MNP-20]
MNGPTASPRTVQRSHSPGIIVCSGPDDPRLYEVDDEFRKVLQGLAPIVGASRRSGARFFHPTATVARGTLTLQRELAFPSHTLLQPGRTFPVLARYSNASVSDDLSPDIRGITLRLLGGRGHDALEESLLDLTLNTGECFFPHTARIFHDYALGGAHRDRVFEAEPHLLEVMWDVIRGPAPFEAYVYHSQTPRCFVDATGEGHLVRFRLLPVGQPPALDTYTPGDRQFPPEPPDTIPRDPADPRRPTALHDHLRTRIGAGELTARLQLQLHPLGADPHENRSVLDSSRAWPASAHPWHDVGTLHLSNLLPPQPSESLVFDPSHAPADLGIALATSPDEHASTNHLRVLLYRMASSARRGDPMPPGLAALAKPRTTANPPRTNSEPASGRTICIIGAGPTGLALARELHGSGHHPVVLDSAPHVGGKCSSVELDGRGYDLGGHLCTTRYAALGQLAADLGMASEAVTPYLIHSLTDHTTVPPDLSPLHRDQAHARYADLRAQEFPEIAEPGLAHSARALSTPTADWLEQHRLTPLAEALGTAYTAAGYGHLASGLPALYFAKYAEFTGLVADRPGLRASVGTYTIAGGFGELWRRVADQLPDVRLDTRIERIERGRSGIRVKTTAGPLEADALVLTVPLGPLLPVLDATDEERQLAEKVRHLDYHTLVFDALGLPRSGFYLLRERTEGAPEPGRCVSFHHRYRDRDTYTGYAYGTPGAPASALPGLLSEDAVRLGGRLVSVRMQRQWAFMPYFDSADLAAGALDRLEDLQGQQNTYHAGSLPAFELVECNVAYAQQLARRHFPAVVPSPKAKPTAPATDRTDVTRLTSWLATTIAAELRIPPGDISLVAPLDHYPFDSVSVASLQAGLSQVLGIQVSAPEMFNFPTITAIAEHYARRLAAPTDATGHVSHASRPSLALSLTRVQPFFCLGGAVGTVQYLRPLAHELGRGRPFYALQAVGHDGTEVPLTDIGEQAERYVHEVRAIQPHGPYVLGGHSFGGLVAYETALRLRAAGEEIARVVLIDTYVPVPGQQPPPQDETAAVEELMTMNRLTNPQAASTPPLPGTTTSSQHQRDQLARNLGSTGMLPFDEFVLALLDVYQANLEATVAYTPPPSDLPVTLIQAAEGFPQVLHGERHVELQLRHPQGGWDPAALPRLRAVEVPGNHFTIFQPPHLAELAEAVRGCLD